MPGRTAEFDNARASKFKVLCTYTLRSEAISHRRSIVNFSHGTIDMRRRHTILYCSTLLLCSPNRGVVHLQPQLLSGTESSELAQRTFVAKRREVNDSFK